MAEKRRGTEGENCKWLYPATIPRSGWAPTSRLGMLYAIANRTAQSPYHRPSKESIVSRIATSCTKISIVSNRQVNWAYLDLISNMGGITWLELFILFDTGGNRTAAGRHTKSQDAIERAQVRRGANAGKMLRSSNADNHADATALPNFEETLKRFKAIICDIMKHEASKGYGALFKAEQMEQLRRLAGLGVGASASHRRRLQGR